MALLQQLIARRTIVLLLFLIFLSMKPAQGQGTGSEPKIPVILDTDANNEIDDQHAMAYLFLNQQVFDILGITVNATSNGGDIDKQYEEAKRIADLFEMETSVPLLKTTTPTMLPIHGFPISP